MNGKEQDRTEECTIQVGEAFASRRATQYCSLRPDMVTEMREERSMWAKYS